MNPSHLKSNRYAYLVFLAVCFCMTLKLSAGPITHAFLTDHYFRLVPVYSEEAKNAFRAGTLFSDVYLLGKTSKEETYFAGSTLQDVLSEPNPFFAGMKFHSLVDDLRENFVMEGNYEELLDHLPVTHKLVYLKFLEDQVIFSSVDKGQWKLVANQISDEERQFGLDEEALKRWHYLLDLSFSYEPSRLIFLAHLKGNGLLGVSPEEIAEWNKTFEAASKEESVTTYVGNLLKMYASQINQQ